MASNGGFDYDTVYTMPVYLRRFYIKELEEWKKKEAEHAKKGAPNTPPNIPKRPAVGKK
jgi:hypothetical protein